MSENPDSYYNLAERIEEAFAEIDSDAVTELAQNDEEYTELKGEAGQLKRACPTIEKVLNGSGAISLTADEHTALVQYLNLIRQMEDIERQKIYFRGHTDCFAYLKKIGVI